MQKQKPGRPTLSEKEPTVRVNAKVPQSVKDSITNLGKGNVSFGIRRMMQLGNFIHWPEFESVPEVSAIYLIFSGSGELLYIGQTRGLRYRFMTHHRSQQFKDADSIAFWIEITEDSLIDIEKHFIENLSPSLNGSELPSAVIEEYGTCPKIVCVTHGDPSTEQQVELGGVLSGAPLTPAMARRAARIATGHECGVTVMDGDRGYILYSEKRNSQRKVEIDEQVVGEEAD